MRYNNLSSYLKTRYGGKIGKICIDGGFSCPNRDGKCGTGGCIFCGERGSGEHIDGRKPIREQVEDALARSRSDGYIAYFQNFTNTYADASTLRSRYDEALYDARIVALAIGTRPDCIDEEIAELIASYRDRLDVWVELGLQSASDTTAELINRGYKTEVYLKAADILTRHGIPHVTHIIIGLPGEGRDEVLNTVEVINSTHPFGVKIHSLYVMKGTSLAEMYLKNLYTPPTLSEFVSLTADVIERIRPDTVIHRLTGDCPDGLLLAPEWNRDKNAVLAAIRQELEKRKTEQGKLYRPHS
ncbi:MAG: TIGR01212 family radical SAM protein [Clostridia bacterium]|nr:TIGR01212 family radical SAM protein [Clostridia bacterium]